MGSEARCRSPVAADAIAGAAGAGCPAPTAATEAAAAAAAAPVVGARTPGCPRGAFRSCCSGAGPAECTCPRALVPRYSDHHLANKEISFRLVTHRA